MDEFGVLVESMGFKPHGKSAPMAFLKSKPQSNLSFTNGFPQDINIAPKNDFFVDDLDGIFQPRKSRSTSNFLYDSNEFFGGMSSSSKAVGGNQGDNDLDSVFSFSSSSYAEKVNSNDDLLTSSPKKTDGIDALLGDFAKADFVQRDVEDNRFKSDDLIPGFASSDDKVKSNVGDDPILAFQPSKPPPDAASWPFDDSEPMQQNTRNVVQSPIDELESFVMGKGQEKSTLQKQVNKDKGKTVKVTKIKETATLKESNLDDIFGMGAPSTKISKPISKMKDPVFDALFNDVEPEVETTIPKARKSTSPTIFMDDFSSFFDDDVNSFGKFKDIDGESDERRRRRLNTHMNTQERMAKALAEKKQRDMQSIYEQAEKDRLADTLDNNIKHWAAGKEGNLRALLASLQDVLWPECGWQAVPLTDLITSTAVKKVYYKATLYLHPDKVQQKGSNPQQKYIAEKVFHILKEAWKKCSAEELR